MNDTHQQTIQLNNRGLVKEATAFLDQVAKESMPRGIKVHDQKNAVHAILYEESRFIILLPDGKNTSAQLYGNWGEALHMTERFLAKKESIQNTRLILSHYHHE